MRRAVDRSAGPAVSDHARFETGGDGYRYEPLHCRSDAGGRPPGRNVERRGSESARQTRLEPDQHAGIQRGCAGRAEGERTRPVVVVPAVAVNLTDTAELFPSAAPRVVHVSVKANVDKAAGEVRLNMPAGWRVEPKSQPFQIAAIGEQRETMFS